MRSNLYLFAALFGMLPISANAAQLFDYVAGADLTPTQERALGALQASASNTSLNIVKVDPEALKEGSIEIPLPTDPKAFNIILPENAPANADRPLRTNPSKPSSSNLELSGTLSPVPGSDGFMWAGSKAPGDSTSSAILTYIGSDVSGSIYSPAGHFELTPLPGGLSALVRIDASKFPPDDPEDNANAPSDGADMAPLGQPAADASAVTTVSVLVAATPAALSKISGLQNTAIQAIAVSNTAFRNSGMPVEFSLAGTYQSNDYQESGDMTKDVARLAAPGDGYLDDVLKARDADKADLVVLLTDDPSFCGYSRQIYASATSAVSVVDGPCAVGNLSFPHETGHLLGACHNVQASSGCPFADGHGFYDIARQVRDIMSYDCPGTVGPDGDVCKRLPMFSEPPSLGVAGSSNAARVIAANAPRAAQFR